MPKTKIIRLRPDAKRRITLGKIAEGISSYTATINKKNRIILEPFIEIPSYEQWLFNNKAALKQVKQGLKDSAKGRVRSKGSFATYVDKNTD